MDNNLPPYMQLYLIFHSTVDVADRKHVPHATEKEK